MREEDNIEKDDLGEDRQNASEIDGYDGIEDFVEYDDLVNLEGLPQIDELDKTDDLSNIPKISATIDFNTSQPGAGDEQLVDIPLPEIEEDIPLPESENFGIASELPDASDIDTVFPQISYDEEETQPEEDIMSIPEGEEEVQPEEGIMSIPEGEEEVQPEEGIMSIPEGEEEVQPEEGIMSIPEGEEEVQPEEGIMSIPEDEEEVQPEEDIMSIPEGEEEVQPQEDIMSLLEGEEETLENGESESIDNMLDGLLDDFDQTGSVGDEQPEEKADINDSNAVPEDISDLLGMLSDDSESSNIISIDDVSQESIPDISEISNVPEDSGEEDIASILPTEMPEEEKGEKPGFFKKVFGNVVTDEIAEAEKKQQEEEAQKLEEAEKKKEEKALEKAKKAEEKAKIKAEKAEQKAAEKAKKAEEKAAKKAEKLAKKEEEEAAAANEVVGKLNKAGVSIVVAAGVIILVGIIIGTNSFGSSLEKKKAGDYFGMHKYSQAYESAIGTNMKKKDPEQYQKIVTVMKVQHSLDAYQNYENVKKYPEALDALLMGLKKYDANKSIAYKLEIENDLESVYNKILDILSDEFGLSKSQAYDILGMSSSEYSKKVTEIAIK